MKVKDIIDIMEKHYPLDAQEDWDRCGLQIGDRNADVDKIMIALNADRDTLQDAIDNHCQMLITHHPFLLDPINNIDKDDFMGAFIYKATLNNIAVYSAHTSLDKISMNNWLIEKLDVKNIRDCEDSGVCKMADLKQPLSQDEFIQLVRSVYHIDHIKYAGKKNMIKTVAVCGGSGGDFLDDLYGRADAYITGDTKYRHAKNAFDHDILLVDISHHAEQVMIHGLKEVLEKEIDIDIVENNKDDYFTYL